MAGSFVLFITEITRCTKMESLTLPTTSPTLEEWLVKVIELAEMAKLLSLIIYLSTFIAH